MMTMMTSMNTRVGMMLALLVGVARAQDVPCGAITCQNNSTCMDGSTDFEDHVQPDGTVLDIHPTDTSTHCLCKPGWTGVACDVPYRSCDQTSHKCYHGGECVLGLIDKYDNEQLYCNCDSAIDAEGNVYVGKYCEQKAITYCGGDTSRFCLNGGLCNDEYPNMGKACYCDESHEGEHCEFEKHKVPTCTMDCQNGGHCKLGTPPKNDLDYFNVSGNAIEVLQYCECKHPWHGQFCEVASEQCGDNQCFHGSKCVEAQVNGNTLHHCDCRFANTEEKSYAGQYCQYEATQYCDKGAGDINGHLFCVNGGTCQSDSYLGCICPEDYRGFSCEYYVDENAEDNPHAPPTDHIDDTICSLDCNGRGKCRKGIKEKPSDEKVGDAEHLNGDDALSNENFEHCSCEKGWTGLQCEHEATECGGGEYHCFHGGECYTGGDEQKCDCSTAASTELETNHFAGEQCEHPATEICLEGEAHKYNPNQGLSFCVNYGTCKAKVKSGEAHPGCNCDEDKWTGPHCEIKVAQQTAPAPSPTTAIKDDGSGDNDALQVVTAIIAVLAVVSVVGFAIRHCVRNYGTSKSRMDKNALHWESNRSLGGGYRDEPINEINLSPRRDSNIKAKLSSEPPSRAPAPSSRDPFAAHLMAPLAPTPASNAPAPDDGPQVYLGPPQDEDGHVLHSVEIL